MKLHITSINEDRARDLYSVKASKLVTALSYDAIAKLEDGLYVWLTPDDLSTLSVLELLKSAPFKTKDSTELHCTVLYCNNAIPLHIEVPDDKPRYARAVKIDTWVDHKGRTIAVLLLDKDGDLQDLHNVFIDQGLKHSYPEYNAHMTVAKDIEVTGEVERWLQVVNTRLRDYPLWVGFNDAVRGATIG